MKKKKLSVVSSDILYFVCYLIEIASACLKFDCWKRSHSYGLWILLFFGHRNELDQNLFIWFLSCFLHTYISFNTVITDHRNFILSKATISNDRSNFFVLIFYLDLYWSSPSTQSTTIIRFTWNSFLLSQIGSFRVFIIILFL